MAAEEGGGGLGRGVSFRPNKLFEGKNVLPEMAQEETPPPFFCGHFREDIFSFKYFTHISITTPIVSALKNCYI
jgi:hypothetical protein